MLKCPYCGSEKVTELTPLGVSKPRNLFKYEYAQHCRVCNKDFNKMSRLLQTEEDPDKILRLLTLPSSGELQEQITLQKQVNYQ